jgi:hypothetical protein
MMMSVSSAYWMIRKSLVYSKGMGRLSIFKSLTLFNKVCRKSAAKTKSKGDRGSPYPTPLLQWKILPGTLLRRIVDVPELKMDLIH